MTKCLFCDKPAYYGYIDKRLCCKYHACNDMINLAHRKCLSCSLLPSFGYPGTKTALYCSIHASEDMIDVKHKRCLSCSSYPSFGYPGTKTVLCCKKHATSKMVDLNHKKRKFEGEIFSLLLCND